MNRAEREIYLIAEMLKERGQIGSGIPEEPLARKNLLRALFNTRPPMSASKEFLSVQDAYLQALTAEKGIVEIADMNPIENDNRIYLWRGDITRLKVDAIVNAANAQMLGCFHPGHSCIDNAIHTAAGIQLRQECHAIMCRQGHPEKAGGAKITAGYNLPAKHIIHTVGPIVNGTPSGPERQALSNCYTACLNTMNENKLTSIAFCCISTGVFSYPRQEAAQIAVDTVVDYLKRDTYLESIIFNVFTQEDFEIYEERLNIK